MTKFDEYEAIYNKYHAIYGDKVAVLYQFGIFHEIYGIDNDTEKFGNCEELANLLNIKLTRESTKKTYNDRTNPLMAGINSVSLEANVERLVEYGYTVVVVNQTNKNPDKTFNREVVEIQSPGTIIDMKNRRDPNNVSVVIKSYKSRVTGLTAYYIGMASIDITTGKTFWYETNSTVQDNMLAFDELLRFFQTFNPVEVLLSGDTSCVTDDMISSWGFRRVSDASDSVLLKDVKPIVYDAYPFSFSLDSVEHQEQYLFEKYESLCGGLSALEYLGLTRAPLATKAFINLLEFCNDHNKLFTCNLERPAQWGTSGHLVLDTNSTVQLGLLESYYGQTRNNSIFGLLAKHTMTMMGFRMLRSQLVNGVVSATELEHRYDVVSTFLSDYEVIGKHLKGIRDLDRLHRKIGLRNILPSEISMIMRSYEKIKSLYAFVEELGVLVTQAEQEKLQSARVAFLETFDAEECAKYTSIDNIETRIFKKGYDSNIDQMHDKLQLIEAQQQQFCCDLSEAIKKGMKPCTYTENDDTCTITITHRQYEVVKSLYKFSIVRKNKSNIVLREEELTARYLEKKKIIKPFVEASKACFDRFISTINESMQPVLANIARTVGMIDLYQCISMWSDIKNYCRPVISDERQGMSYVQAKKLRHPLVEVRTSYVPQDLELGLSDNHGMLLYGVNQSGKSCTMKSLGIAVVMAQAGFFVPAESFTFYPYKNLMTRILGNDNIDKGLSAYAVEMIELRSILVRSNCNTLVLGDELCHGTESASAVSLVSASIMDLSKKNTSFVFATHLHELATMPEVNSLPNVFYKHLAVTFDNDKIIYDRIMQDGSGQGLYGIEVAKHLNLPADVLACAYQIRKKYFSEKEVVSAKKSKYSKNLVLLSCAIRECVQKAVHTHHIRYQCEADAKGYVKAGMHKDDNDNLAPLCEQHHSEVHHGTSEGQQLVIFGYEGKRLNYTYRKKLNSLHKKIHVRKEK